MPQEKTEKLPHAACPIGSSNALDQAPHPGLTAVVHDAAVSRFAKGLFGG
jgi:hypothetical protein